MSRKLPKIVIRAADEDRLAELANGLLGTRPELGEGLLAELARAHLASGAALPANTVQMGTTVTYETEGRTRQVTLVYPAQQYVASAWFRLVFARDSCRLRVVHILWRRPIALLHKLREVFK